MDRYNRHRTREASLVIARWCVIAFLCASAPALTRAAPEWQKRLSPPEPGSFPLPHPLTASYRCGWSGLPAAAIDVSYTRPKSDVIQLDAKGGTIGLARTLWKLDVTHTARARASTLLPIDMRQTEVYSDETVRTELEF